MEEDKTSETPAEKLEYEEWTKVEDALVSLGGYSKYQKWITFALIFPQFPTAMIVLSPVFTGTNKVPLPCHPNTYFHENDTCVLNCTSEVLTISSIVQEWDLVCGRAWIVDTITSCQMAGMMTGAFLSSLFSDTFGRKKCFIMQTFCMGILGMLPATAFNPLSYAIARFFAGLGVGACFVVYLSHLMEFLTPNWRTICGTFSLWPMGEMVLALLAYFIPSWRWLIVSCAVWPFVLLMFYKTIQESPRWLLIRKKTTEAHNVFSTIAKWNDKEPPNMASVEHLQNAILKEESSQIHGLKAVKLIMSNPKLRLNMAIETLSNITCAIVYYGVAFNAKNLSGSPYMNMLYAGIFDFFASPAALLFNNWLGRRKTFTIYMTMGTAFILAILVLILHTGLDNIDPSVVTILSLCGRFGIVGAWGALTCIILETAPTNLRSTCLGWCAFAGYFGGILAPQLATLQNYSASLPYIILCTLTVSSSIASWFLSEMVQKPLEDTVG